MGEKCRQSGKVIHFSRGKAEAQLRSLLQKTPEYSGGVYSCPYCGFYHVGREKKNSHKNKYKG